MPAGLLAGAGLEPAFTAIAAPPAGTAPVNLAAHKPAQARFLDGSTAQLQPESQPAYATDGDRTTYVQAPWCGRRRRRPRHALSHPALPGPLAGAPAGAAGLCGLRRLWRGPGPPGMLA